MEKLVVLLFFGLTAFSFCDDDVTTTTACPDVCITLYDPVCGKNSQGTRIFSNGCDLDVHNCKNPNDQYKQVNGEECGLNATTTTKGPQV